MQRKIKVFKSGGGCEKHAWRTLPQPLQSWCLRTVAKNMHDAPSRNHCKADVYGQPPELKTSIFPWALTRTELSASWPLSSPGLLSAYSASDRLSLLSEIIWLHSFRHPISLDRSTPAAASIVAQKKYGPNMKYPHLIRFTIHLNKSPN